MKRRIIPWGRSLGVALALATAACDRSDPAEAASASGDEGGWTRAPQITAVNWSANGPVVSGVAGPGARVVLREDGAGAFAASTDASGRFEVHVAPLTHGVLLTPEVQKGQEAAPGRQVLVLAPGETPLAALLAAGQASRRLGAGGPLDSIDGDGRGLVASGRATTGDAVTLSTGRGESITVAAGEGGLWEAAPPGLADGPASLTVGARVYAYPGPGDDRGRLERLEGGWRITRQIENGARQTSWFPDP